MSTWASPVIIIPKKGLELPTDPGTPLPVTAKLRLVCDYRKLNKKLPADFWSYDKEGQRIEKHGINHLGKFKWNIAPFGLALLPSYYSKAMQDILSGLEDFARNYMDDVLIVSYTEKEHLDHIRQVFERFCKFKMKLKLTKCKFW